MPVAFRWVISILPFFLAGSLGGQVVFSRRLYRGQGASYQQIWTWNAASGSLNALTHSPRNHYLPTCIGGKITFVSPEKWAENSKLWSFDPATGEERVVGLAPAQKGRPEAARKNGCDWSAKAGALEACATDEDLSLSRAGQQIGHFHIQVKECSDERGGTHGPCATPILSLEWSPDGKWLLVGELGLETNSTAPQFDYYLVNPASMKLQKVASAEQYSMMWLPGRDELFYTTPRDMASLPGAGRARRVWVRQLMLFNPATGTNRAITSRVADNVDATWCRQ
jgi:hypothetical protein